MDRLVDHLLVFEGDGIVRDFPGNYAIYRASLDEKGKGSLPGTIIEPAKEEPVAQVTETAKRKPGFKEKREFEILGKEIESLNNEKTEVTNSLNSGTLPFDQLEKLSNRIGEITTTLDEKELRWLELSELF
jgi:ATP-binding cassette subfamily F protein uup